jgi:simple sugar transport system ATP-binding protein
MQKSLNRAVILLSYELDEVLALADRVLVFNSGEVTGTLVGNQITYDNIGKLMVSDTKMDLKKQEEN